jgi:hypothetical protein
MLIRSSGSSVGYWVSVGTESALFAPEALDRGTALTTREVPPYTTAQYLRSAQQVFEGTRKGVDASNTDQTKRLL